MCGGVEVKLCGKESERASERERGCVCTCEKASVRGRKAQVPEWGVRSDYRKQAVPMFSPASSLVSPALPGI